MSATAVLRRPKMTIESQMKASQWLFKNSAFLEAMTLEEITGAINGQAKVDSPVALSSVRRLMEAASFTWKAKTKSKERLGKQAMYDKILTLQGLIEKQAEQLHHQQAAIETILRRVDAIVTNTQWISVPPDDE